MSPLPRRLSSPYFVTARLGRHSGLYDREVSDGKILVGIERPPDSAITELQTALGAVRHALVKTI